MRRIVLLALMAGCAQSADGGRVDAAAEPDAAVSDSGAADTGAMDAGMDAGVVDAEPGDAGSDAGVVDTWDDGIAPLFATYCVPCHDTGNANRDYNLYGDAFRDRAEIRCGVAPSGMRPSGCVGFPPPEQFPVGSGPFPSVEERSRIVSWIEAGAPQQ